MQNISVDEVFEKVTAVLARRSAELVSVDFSAA
jgi:hypothetical protein